MGIGLEAEGAEHDPVDQFFRTGAFPENSEFFPHCIGVSFGEGQGGAVKLDFHEVDDPVVPINEQVYLGARFVADARFHFGMWAKSIRFRRQKKISASECG